MRIVFGLKTSRDSISEQNNSRLGLSYLNMRRGLGLGIVLRVIGSCRVSEEVGLRGAVVLALVGNKSGYTYKRLRQYDSPFFKLGV